MEPIRVLQVCGEPFAGGGQESYLMNMYRHIDCNICCLGIH